MNNNLPTNLHNQNTQIFMCLKCNQNNLPFYDSKERSHENYNREFIASEDIKMFFKDINDLDSQQQDKDSIDDLDISPIINCKYVDIKSLKIEEVGNKTFSILHLNISSLEKSKDELESTLSMLNFKFDVIGISETKIKANTIPKFDLNISGYKHYVTPSEANKGGAIMYILDKHDTIPRKGLEKIMYKSRVLESVFVEIVVPSKKKHYLRLHLQTSFNGS